MNKNFENKVKEFIEKNKIWIDNTPKIIKSVTNQLWTLEEQIIKIVNKEAINTLLLYNKEVLNILYFETANWKNQNNKTTFNKKLPWLWRFAIFNFIELSKEKWLKKILFDIKLSEIWFYEKIFEELKKSNIIKSVKIIYSEKTIFQIEI